MVESSSGSLERWKHNTFVVTSPLDSLNYILSICSKYVVTSGIRLEDNEKSSCWTYHVHTCIQRIDVSCSYDCPSKTASADTLEKCYEYFMDPETQSTSEMMSFTIMFQ